MTEKKTDAFFVLLAAENVADSCSKMKARAALAVTHMAVIYLRHVLPPGAREGGRRRRRRGGGGGGDDVVPAVLSTAKQTYSRRAFFSLVLNSAYNQAISVSACALAA